MMMTTRTDITTVDGEHVCTARGSGRARGIGRCPATRTPSPAPNSSRSSTTPPGLDLVQYAGASGDFNVIHWNERIAKSVGLPDVIAHGMFTMAQAGRYLTELAGGTRPP